jgi:Mrp family chromosome partitioning ATPase
MRENAIKDLRILAVASLKGGVGKTTLTAHLAVQAERSGAGPVALIDTDPRGAFLPGGIAGSPLPRPLPRLTSLSFPHISQR